MCATRLAGHLVPSPIEGVYNLEVVGMVRNPSGGYELVAKFATHLDEDYARGLVNEYLADKVVDMLADMKSLDDSVLTRGKTDLPWPMIDPTSH